VESFAAERGALAARVTDRRELPDAADEVEVSFADPDDAVRERLAGMGLSAAARELDETVRASKVADTNVADSVEERVRELVDDGDPDAFDPAEHTGGEPDHEAATESGSVADGGTAPEPEEDSAEEVAGADGRNSVDEDAEDDRTSSVDGTTDTVSDPNEPEADDPAEYDASAESDGQSSVGDFL
jgi:exonuclease SbcD